MKAFVSEKKPLVLVFKFPGAAILNNCDVSWLATRHVTIIQDGGDREIGKPKQAFYKFTFFGYKRFDWKKFETF